ncbi:MAG: hypothetical protein WD049_03950 [Candidatus Paceibacterota bacterium]
MTTLSLIATICLGVSMLGISVMLWWKWHEACRHPVRGSFRKYITALDYVVLVSLHRSGHVAHRTSRRLKRGVFGYLPELLLEFSVIGVHRCYIQYRRILLTLRGHAARRDRRSRRNASAYMQSLASKPEEQNNGQ